MLQFHWNDPRISLQQYRYCELVIAHVGTDSRTAVKDNGQIAKTGADFPERAFDGNGRKAKDFREGCLGGVTAVPFAARCGFRRMVAVFFTSLPIALPQAFR